MSRTRNVEIDAARYFGVPELKRLKGALAIDVTERSFPPYLDDLQADWVASVAMPAFRLVAAEKGAGNARRFCSIGTGVGLDALGAIEIFDADLVGVTDVHEEIVAAARNNILSGLKDRDSLRLLAGTGDLLAPLAADRPLFDAIYENLPNVPADDRTELSEGRARSSFFGPRSEDVPQTVRDSLLTLHYLALRQARSFLAPQGVVLSLLGARLPLRHFLDMAEQAGYRPSILTYGWKIQAEAENVLQGHASWQERGLGPFHFYRPADLEAAFRGLAPDQAALQALEIEQSLQAGRLDAKEALELWRGGEEIAHAYIVLASRERDGDDRKD